MAMGEARILEPGLLTTIQDASGRAGLGRFGIPPGGAMDARAARLAIASSGTTATRPSSR